MINRAVMSYWSAPLKGAAYRTWRTEADLHAAWKMSAALLRKHFPEVALVTDTPGLEYLKPLELPFTEVSTELDDMDPAFYPIWSLGKIKAYALQTKPFVHVDTDAFLFKRPPDRILNAPVCAQMPEKFTRTNKACMNYNLSGMLQSVANLPPVVREAAGRPIQYAVNCGFFGGNDLATIKAYTDLSFKCLEMDPKGWLSMDGFHALLILEQWMICTAIRERGSFIEYLYPCCHGPRGTLDVQQQKRIGFVHLWSSDKRDPKQLQRVHDWFEKGLEHADGRTAS